MKANKALEILLALLNARKERSRAAARAASAEHRKASQLTNQVAQYSQDYDTQWERTATQGATVLDLQARAAFGSQLHHTLAAQQEALIASEQNSRFQLQQAFQDQRRAEVLGKYLTNKKRASDLAREKAETRTLEDDRAWHSRRS